MRKRTVYVLAAGINTGTKTNEQRSGGYVNNRGYDKRKWKEARVRYLMTHPWCEIHLTNETMQTIVAVQVTHRRIPSEGENLYDPLNLMALCPECYKQVSIERSFELDED
jgi:hypothetical protein